MNIKDLKKDASKTIRINSEILAAIESRGMTIQEYIDYKLDKEFQLKIDFKGDNDE